VILKKRHGELVEPTALKAERQPEKASIHFHEERTEKAIFIKKKTHSGRQNITTDGRP